MKLKKLFEENNYKSILMGETAKSIQLDASYFLNEDHTKPEELYDIYISSHGDELFLLLFGDERDIHILCEEWDRKVSIFVSFASDNKDVLWNIKYNVVEIILCKDENVDRKEEGSLNITRKIILPYNIEDDGEIEIPEEEVVEIPFYLIPTSDFLQNEGKVKALENCMPEKEIKILFQKNKTGKGGKKTFEQEDYEKIEGWLRYVYQKCEDK